MSPPYHKALTSGYVCERLSVQAIMASGSKLGLVAVVVTLCVLLLIAAASGCETGHHGCVNAKAGSFLKKDSRKILRTFKRDGGTMIANEELRGSLRALIHCTTTRAVLKGPRLHERNP